MEANESVQSGRDYPNFYQRAPWHDYRSRCFFMITFNKAPEAPVLANIKGYVTGSGINAYSEPTPCGEIIKSVIKSLPDAFPFIELGRYVIMPDHVHFILYVKRAGETHLGEIIRILKKKCTASYKEEFPESPVALENGSLFVTGFNDRIVYREGQLANYRNYVSDNPRRYYLRKAHPEFFNRCENIRIKDKAYSIFGNFLLLRNPDKECVRISSKFSMEELSRRKRRLDEAIRGGGVLVSPFISPKEKEIMRVGINRGASIIRIVENGFPERYKPEGEWINLCSEGRLLVIAPIEFNAKKEKIKRSDCMAMNALAEYIAGIGVESMALIGKGTKD